MIVTSRQKEVVGDLFQLCSKGHPNLEIKNGPHAHVYHKIIREVTFDDYVNVPEYKEFMKAHGGVESYRESAKMYDRIFVEVEDTPFYTVIIPEESVVIN